MTKREIDLLIIADKGGYKNIAFAAGLSELILGGKVMTIQAIMNHFRHKKRGANYPEIKPNIDLTKTGKLNGISLYDFCIKQNLSVELLNEADPSRIGDLSSYSPKCVAISSTWLLSKKDIFAIVSLIRQYLPKTFIVVGGPLVLNSYILYQLRGTNYDVQNPSRDYFFLSFDDQEQLREIDLFVIEQQGEWELAEIVHRLKNGQDPYNTRNCAFYRKGELIFTQRVDEGIHLDKHLISWDQLPEELLPEIVPIQLSTGCPHKCTFCNFVHRKRIMKKTLEGLRFELKALLKRKKIKFLRIVDDTISAQDFRNFCQAMQKEKFDIPWTTFARADAIKEDIPFLLRQTQCTSIQMGIESFDDNMLKVMNKRADKELYRDVLERLAQAGITTRASFILGHPGETEETISNTLHFLQNLNYEGEGTFDFLFAPFLLLPLSPIYESKARKVFELDGYMAKWSHRTMNSEDVPKLIIQIFLSMKENIFFAYIKDDVIPGLPKNVFRKIKVVRQQARQLQLKADIEKKSLGKEFEDKLDQLEKLCLPYL